MYLLKQLCSKAGKACYDFSMLNNNDKILICFSGGKDSYVLLKILIELRKKYPINFELKILVINPNFDLNFENKIKQFLNNENIKNIQFEILNTQIKKVIKKQNQIKKINPCFMCSRLRRGIIYNYALKNGYNKIALGHNLDDAIETHLMNFFYSSKTSFLKPKYLAENGSIEVIRPLIYIDEDLIVKYINKTKFKIIENNCPLKKQKSNREYFKKFIYELKKRNPKIKQNAYHAFFNTLELNSWIKKNK